MKISNIKHLHNSKNNDLQELNDIIEKCSKKAIFMLKGTNGNFEPVIFPERCANCDLCMEICPHFNFVAESIANKE